MVPENLRLNDALKGVFPYDVTGVAVPDSTKDSVMERLSNYETNEKFYEGDQWANPYQNDERKATFNYCKVIVDKAADWFNADGWEVSCYEGNEQVAEFLNTVWKYNNRNSLTLRSTQTGAIKGDSFIYVTVRTKDKYGRDLPRKQWTVRLQTIAPQYVHPVWSHSEDNRMAACFIQYPVEGYDGADETQLFSIYITPETVTTWLGLRQLESIDNPIGEVSVVHVPNFVSHESPFGESDIGHIVPINEEYNLVANSVRKVIRYHAEPTTIIYGAKASTLEKGANAVWSGLPKPSEAKVENLVLQTDLKAVYDYLALLKKQICELSFTPQIAFDSFDVRVATSSAAALELMFQPLLEKTKRRRVAHTEAIAEVNRLIILFQTIVIGDNITALADNPEQLFESYITYTSPLPRDEAVELDTAIKKFNAGVWSQAELIRRVSGVRNHERLIVELLADKRKALAETFEKQRALNGERPSSLSGFLGSECLSEDVEDLMKEVATLEKLQAKEEEPKEKPSKTPALPPVS